MSRVTLGVATATLFGLAAVQPAAAGCCNSCCSTGWAVQPAPVYYAQPAPTVVQLPPQQVIVQVPQPQVVVQQPQPMVHYQTVPAYTVNQGPVYAGPEAVNFALPQYYADEPTRAYPYVSGHDYRPYRAYRPHRKYRAHRHYRHKQAYRWHPHVMRKY